MPINWDETVQNVHLILTDYLFYYPLLNRIDASAYTVKLHDLDRISAHTWYVADAYFD